MYILINFRIISFLYTENVLCPSLKSKKLFFFSLRLESRILLVENLWILPFLKDLDLKWLMDLWPSRSSSFVPLSSHSIESLWGSEQQRKKFPTFFLPFRCFIHSSSLHALVLVLLMDSVVVPYLSFDHFSSNYPSYTRYKSKHVWTLLFSRVEIFRWKSLNFFQVDEIIRSWAHKFHCEISSLSFFVFNFT